MNKCKLILHLCSDGVKNMFSVLRRWYIWHC